MNKSHNIYMQNFIDQGKIAYINGRPITENPYQRKEKVKRRDPETGGQRDFNTPYTAWNEGYTRTRAELERRNRDSVKKDARYKIRKVIS